MLESKIELLPLKIQTSQVEVGLDVIFVVLKSLVVYLDELSKYSDGFVLALTPFAGAKLYR